MQAKKEREDVEGVHGSEDLLKYEKTSQDMEKRMLTLLREEVAHSCSDESV